MYSDLLYKALDIYCIVYTLMSTCINKAIYKGHVCRKGIEFYKMGIKLLNMGYIEAYVYIHWNPKYMLMHQFPINKCQMMQYF